MARFSVRRKLPLIIGCLLFIFLYIKRGQQLRHYELFIPNQEPRVVWDVLADFNNIAKLNTRMMRWRLVDEWHKMDEWRYEVVSYEAMIGAWLLGENENHGHVAVRPVSPPDHYLCHDTFTTRSLHGLLIVDNGSKMHIRRSWQSGQEGTLVVQDVYSDCPLLFHLFCIIETDLNRQAFYHNLRQWFSKD